MFNNEQDITQLSAKSPSAIGSVYFSPLNFPPKFVHPSLRWRVMHKLFLNTMTILIISCL